MINPLSFNFELSKTNYDTHKYRITNSTVSYSSRKVYRYTVNREVYNLRPSAYCRYLIELHLPNPDSVKSDWMNVIQNLGMLTKLVEHLQGIIDFHRIGIVTTDTIFADILYPYKGRNVCKELEIDIREFSTDFSAEDTENSNKLNLALFL